jgi:Zn-dependent protease
MRPSVRLGTISGIPIGLHWSILVIVGLVTVGISGTVLPAAAAGYAGVAYLAVALLVAVGLLVSIVAHELGHALVARNNGVGCRSISLFALGGVAELESEARTPGAAARIAVAGPAVSVAIGAIGVVLSWTAGLVGASALVVAALLVLGVVNLAMAVFNMLPALPLDGGRVLQAALWKRGGDRERATLSAAGVGRFLGWSLVAFGAWQLFSGGTGLWTMVIGWFIATSARAEAGRARFQIMARDWPAPRWWQWSPAVRIAASPGQTGGFPHGGPTGGFPGGGPMGGYAGGAPTSGFPAPPPADDRDRQVVDVTGHPVDTR